MTASTDPKWNPSQGGLPEARMCPDDVHCFYCPPPKKPTNLAEVICADRERLAEQSGATACAREVIGWSSPTAGTITPPPVEPSQHERLLAFARDALRNFWEQDGPEMQEMGVKHGLLIETKYDPAVHGETDCDAKPGDEWFVFADWLRKPVTIMPPPTPASDDLPAAVRWRLELFEHDLARVLADIRVALGKQP